jgi:polysaccharide pyruvyl transferase WcaK-like protein
VRNKRTRQRICFFGHFGTLNFGNESTLQAALYHLQRLLPDAEVACICTGPQVLAATRNIAAFPISRTIISPWNLRNPLAKLLRKIFVGIPSELYRWLDAFRTLRGTDVFVIPGTGLLTDAFGLGGFGPYNVFKWTLMAKLARCKVAFASVGAGPIDTLLGRYFVKSALSLADFRSYRDQPSLQCAKRIGVRVNNDRIYPDLVFSLPEVTLRLGGDKGGRRPTVGVGLMEFAGAYSVEAFAGANTRPYLDELILFAEWLLTNGYDIRLLIGDLDGNDREATAEFRCLLKARLGVYDEHRVVYNPVSSVDGLLSELAATDIVVATRFHNILLALLLNKPVIAISFHHKCASLMSEMGLAEYCHDIRRMDAGRLIEQFQDVQRNAGTLRQLIREKVEQARKALDEQYALIFKSV